MTKKLLFCICGLGSGVLGLNKLALFFSAKSSKALNIPRIHLS